MASDMNPSPPMISTKRLLIGLAVALPGELLRVWASGHIDKRREITTSGPYRFVRHPMYSAFWLLACAQAALIPNWVAGFSGIVGWGILFFMRVGREEQLMTDTFGDEYRAYMGRTKRVIPWVY